MPGADYGVSEAALRADANMKGYLVKIVGEYQRTCLQVRISKIRLNTRFRSPIE